MKCQFTDQLYCFYDVQEKFMTELILMLVRYKEMLGYVG